MFFLKTFILKKRQGFEKYLSQRQLLTKQVLEDSWKEARKLWKPSHFLSFCLNLWEFSHLTARPNWSATVASTLQIVLVQFQLSFVLDCLEDYNLKQHFKGAAETSPHARKVEIPSLSSKKGCMYLKWNCTGLICKATQQLVKKISLLLMFEKSSALVFIVFSKYMLTLEGDRGQYLERWLS